MKNNNICFKKIGFRPFAPDSVLSCSFPSCSEIPPLNEFIYSPDIDTLAIALEVENLDYGDPSKMVRCQSYSVSLCDGDKVLTSAEFSIMMHPWEEIETPRIDLKLHNIDIQLMHYYAINITKKGQKTPILTSRIRFFPEGSQASECVNVIQGFVQTDKIYRNIIFSYADDIRVCFMLENNSYAWGQLPEMTISVVDIEGNRDYYRTNIERLEDNRLIVKTILENSSTLRGTVYAELVILGEKIAGFIFDTSEDFEEGVYTDEELQRICYYSPEEGENIVKERKLRKEKAEAEERVQQLDSLVGLECVKSKVREYADLVRFQNLRRNASLPCEMPPLHSMFLGSPGTGKTTVAKIMGKLLKDAGVLSSGHVVVRERSSLLGKYYSTESENTLEALKEAQGGILFIDEAYQLYQSDDTRDPGKFVIETLLSALADESNRDWMLILAGYPEPMKKMFEMNPGFESRIPKTNIYNFADYLPSELLEIAMRYFKANKYSLTEHAKKSLVDLITSDYAMRDDNFGNARHVMNIIQTGIIPAMARRIVSTPSPSSEELSLIKSGDIPIPVSKTRPTRPRVGFVPR